MISEQPILIQKAEMLIARAQVSLENGGDYEEC